MQTAYHIPPEHVFCECSSYSVCVCVAPDLAVDPCSGNNPLVFILKPFRPLSTVNCRQQTSSRIADIHFSVFATGRPHHRPAQRVILDMEGELPVVIINLPYSGALIKVYGQQVPVMCLERKTVKCQ